MHSPVVFQSRVAGPGAVSHEKAQRIVVAPAPLIRVAGTHLECNSLAVPRMPLPWVLSFKPCVPVPYVLQQFFASLLKGCSAAGTSRTGSSPAAASAAANFLSEVLLGAKAQDEFQGLHLMMALAQVWTQEAYACVRACVLLCVRAKCPARQGLEFEVNSAHASKHYCEGQYWHDCTGVDAQDLMEGKKIR